MENRLNITRPFFGGEFVAPITFADSFDAAIDFDGFDDGGFCLAGWTSHKIDAPNNSAPVKKRTRKNFPRKIKIIPPFRGVFFGEFFGLFFGLLKIEFFGIFSELLGGFIFRFSQGSF